MSLKKHHSETQPSPVQLEEVGKLLQGYRCAVPEILMPLIERYCPPLAQSDNPELAKMLELSTKMTMVGHACSEAAGFPFGKNGAAVSALYGGCCFLADSFIDDYGAEVARRYLDRFEILLTRGWFDLGNEREELFYVIISRIFLLRDAMEPMVRQAMFSLFLAQKRDVLLRTGSASFRQLSRRTQLSMLRQCARDRSGHGIAVLAHLVAPRMQLRMHHLLFLSGALIMFIDDHGDCYADRRCGRVTYMNQVHQPKKVLESIYSGTICQLRKELPENKGKHLLCAFLFRYFITRIEKHECERKKGGLSWSVYE